LRVDSGGPRNHVFDGGPRPQGRWGTLVVQCLLSLFLASLTCLSLLRPGKNAMNACIAATAINVRTVRLCAHVSPKPAETSLVFPSRRKAAVGKEGATDDAIQQSTCNCCLWRRCTWRCSNSNNNNNNTENSLRCRVTMSTSCFVHDGMFHILELV